MGIYVLVKAINFNKNRILIDKLKQNNVEIHYFLG